jgi:hypothetical protein
MFIFRFARADPHRIMRFVLVAVAVFCAGLAVAWMDTHPGWDDAGITAGAVMLAAASGALGGVGIWLSATLAVVPILAAELSGGLGVLLAVPIAVLGAVAGRVVRRLVVGPDHRHDAGSA